MSRIFFEGRLIGTFHSFGNINELRGFLGWLSCSGKAKKGELPVNKKNPSINL